MTVPEGHGPQPPTLGPTPKTSGFAIASLVLGIMGGILLSAIFGFVALSQIKKGERTGKGMAIAGIVLSGVWLLAILAAVAAIILADPDRSTDGSVVTGGWIHVDDLAVGDCLPTYEPADEVVTIEVTPCDQPHTAQVYGAFDLASGDYPEFVDLDAVATPRCDEMLLTFSRKMYDDLSYEITYLYPTEEAWPTDREVLCIVVNASGAFGPEDI